MSMDDRRRLYRIEDQLPLAYRVLSDDEVALAESFDLEFPTVLTDAQPQHVDINTRGLAFFSDNPIPPLSNIALTLRIPSKDIAVRVLASVAYCQYEPEDDVYKIGVKFLLMPDQEQEAFLEYVDTKLFTMQAGTVLSSYMNKKGEL